MKDITDRNVDIIGLTHNVNTGCGSWTDLEEDLGCDGNKVIDDVNRGTYEIMKRKEQD